MSSAPGAMEQAFERAARQRMQMREFAAIHASYRAEIAGLERENERMREALLQIAEGPSDGIVAVARRGLGI